MQKRMKSGCAMAAGEVLSAADVPQRCFPKLTGDAGSAEDSSGCRLPRVFMTTEELLDLKRIVAPGADDVMKREVAPYAARPNTSLGS